MPDDMRSISVRDSVSAEEWQARVDLAALYRLTALHGWDDMIFTHISQASRSTRRSMTRATMRLSSCTFTPIRALLCLHRKRAFSRSRRQPC